MATGKKNGRRGQGKSEGYTNNTFGTGNDPHNVHNKNRNAFWGSTPPPKWVKQHFVTHATKPQKIQHITEMYKKHFDRAPDELEINYFLDNVSAIMTGDLSMLIPPLQLLPYQRVQFAKDTYYMNKIKPSLQQINDFLIHFEDIVNLKRPIP